MLLEFVSFCQELVVSSYESHCEANCHSLSVLHPLFLPYIVELASGSHTFIPDRRVYYIHSVTCLPTISRYQTKFRIARIISVLLKFTAMKSLCGLCGSLTVKFSGQNSFPFLLTGRVPLQIRWSDDYRAYYIDSLFVIADTMTFEITLCITYIYVTSLPFITLAYLPGLRNAVKSNLLKCPCLRPTTVVTNGGRKIYTSALRRNNYAGAQRNNDVAGEKKMLELKLRGWLILNYL